MMRNLVKTKLKLWTEDKDTSYEYITEIAEFFSGNRQWEKGTPDDSYSAWFRNIAE